MAKDELMTWESNNSIAKGLCTLIAGMLQTETNPEQVRSLVSIHAFTAVEVISRMDAWLYDATKAMTEAYHQQATTMLAGSVQVALDTKCYGSIDWMIDQLMPLNIPVAVIAPLLLKTKNFRDEVKQRGALLVLVEQQLIDSNDPERDELMHHLR